MEKRRHRRFNLQVPLSITLYESQPVTRFALTKNISSGGVLFTSGEEPNVGVAIEYLVNLGDSTERSIPLRCMGTVLRYEQVPGAEKPVFEVAATIERYEFVRKGVN